MSCLFNSLSHFIAQTEPQTIRQRICDYLQANSPIIDGMATHDVLQLESSSSPDHYILAMRALTTWGGAIEIQAACNIWNARIIVHDVRRLAEEKKTIEFLPVSTYMDHVYFVLRKSKKISCNILKWETCGKYRP